MMFISLFLACTSPSKDGDVREGDDTTGGIDSTGTTDTGPVAYETYACGWEKRDPGTIESTGVAEGDVLADLTLIDQCGESFRIWDMYAEYFLLFVTAAW